MRESPPCRVTKTHAAPPRDDQTDVIGRGGWKLIGELCRFRAHSREHNARARATVTPWGRGRLGLLSGNGRGWNSSCTRWSGPIQRQQDPGQ
eukprot:6043690-Pyramimonas_sp.AAC.1